jgi:hypothetical protein
MTGIAQKPLAGVRWLAGPDATIYFCEPPITPVTTPLSISPWKASSPFAGQLALSIRWMAATGGRAATVNAPRVVIGVQSGATAVQSESRMRCSMIADL